MNGLNALMRFAQQRGDGLLPELCDLFAAEAEKAAQSNIVDLVPRDHISAQSGPNPVACLPDELPHNVVLFRPALTAKPKPNKAYITRITRAPRKSRAPRLLNRKS